MGLLAAGLCGWTCMPAWCQVMAISPDGSTTIYKGPVVVSTEGVRAIPVTFHAAAIPSPSAVNEPLSVVAAIRDSASRHSLSQALVAAVAWQESHMRQDAVSAKGARGVMQLMPGTATGLRVDPDNLSANVDGGAAYLAQMLDRFHGDIIKTLAAYNAGPEAVERYHGVPPYPETQAYVNAVMDRLADITDRKVHP